MKVPAPSSPPQPNPPSWIQSNYPLSKLTSLQVGGNCRWLADVTSPRRLEEVWLWSQREKIAALFIGEGSNIIFSDLGFAGLIIRNQIRHRHCNGSQVEVGGGDNLEDFITWLNGRRLAGMERMFGIPGTVAGAVVGNAGAYGQEIGDAVEKIEVWSPQGTRKIIKDEADFAYRDSILKRHRQLFVTRCWLRLRKTRKNLQAISDVILSKRLEKYPRGLRCPGSFFKNVLVSELDLKALERVPDEFIQFGKIPAGKLLQAVGANGTRRGDAEIASYHGNLFINQGQASSHDILGLADEFAGRVWERFHIRLEPEILIVDNGNWPNLRIQSDAGGPFSAQRWQHDKKKD